MGMSSGRWLRDDNGYEWCVSLSLPHRGDVSVAGLLYSHCSEGVYESVDSRECRCMIASSSNTVRTC